MCSDADIDACLSKAARRGSLGEDDRRGSKTRKALPVTSRHATRASFQRAEVREVFIVSIPRREEERERKGEEGSTGVLSVTQLGSRENC